MNQACRKDFEISTFSLVTTQLNQLYILMTLMLYEKDVKMWQAH